MSQERITIEGKIVSISDDREKKMNKGFTYGYQVLKVKTWDGLYSVLLSTNNFNKYGFIPKEGHWIRVEGTLSNDYDKSVSRLKSIVHIEEPVVERLLKKLRS